MMMTDAGHLPSPSHRYQIFIIGPNDVLRTPSGTVRLFDTLEDAQRAAQDHGGFVQPAGASPPGGFDRTFG
jgi:hypothetical protein